MNPLEAILEGSEIANLFGDDSETLATYLKHAAKYDTNKNASIENFWLSKSINCNKYLSFCTCCMKKKILVCRCKEISSYRN